MRPAQLRFMAIAIAASMLGWSLSTLVLGGGATQGRSLGPVAVSQTAFNPTIGQKTRVSVEVRRTGALTVSILDRDGVLARHVAVGASVKRGKVTFVWNGSDDRGEIVPDEAYSLKIDFAAKGESVTYFPALESAEESSATSAIYDRRRGVLSYSLPWPARVHVQAGRAKLDPKTKQPTGPVLKTLINREPRLGGSVIEYWNGIDESGTVYVPDLPDFRIAIFATRLPENSIICTGNRSTKFVDVLAKRRGTPLLPRRHPGHHHQGLSAVDDISPSLALKPRNATWVVKEKAWRVGPERLGFDVSLKGPTAGNFAKHPGRVVVFLGERQVLERPAGPPPLGLEVPTDGLWPGDSQILTVNWGSDYGPAAVNSIRLTR